MATVLELYEKLKPKLGEAETRSLLEFIETSMQQDAAAKADLQRTEFTLREETHQLAAGLRTEMQAGDASLGEEIQKVRAELIK